MKSRQDDLASSLAGSYSSDGAPPEPLSPEAFHNPVPQPSYFQDRRQYWTTSFNCSVEQVLSPAPYAPHVPLTTSSVDPMLFAQLSFKSRSSDEHMKLGEEDDNSVAEMVQRFIPSALIKHETIPQSLSAVTSPLLEKNSRFRLLYYHFIQNTCGVLVPYDDQNNPFCTILAQMALHPSAQHLLAALLACSAVQRVGMNRQNLPKHLISYLLQTTFKGLRKALAKPLEASQDTTLATVIAFSLLNIISGDYEQWRKHLNGAREII